MVGKLVRWLGGREKPVGLVRWSGGWEKPIGWSGGGVVGKNLSGGKLVRLIGG